MNTTIEIAKLISIGIARFMLWILSWAIAFILSCGIAYLTFKLVTLIA
jgi:hypothetical protein